MAWTAPRDWTAISGGIVTAASLNTDVRDNLGVLSTHTHTGAAGMGAATMTGLTLTALGTLTFNNTTADPDAAGELQRNGNDLLFYGSSAVNLTASDASAGTASLRSLGTTSVKAAAGNHTHTLSQEAASQSGETTVTVLGDNTEDTVITIARAAAASSNVVFVAGSIRAQSISGQTAIAYLRAGATQLATVTFTADTVAYFLQAIHLPGSTSSVDYKLTVKWDYSGQNSNFMGNLGITEVTF
jgi:hypothetical protein